MDARARYNAWLCNPLIDDQTKAELRALKDDPGEIEDRFYRWLEFGTGVSGALLAPGPTGSTSTPSAWQPKP